MRRETFVTGDAVNVAARLEQAAAPGRDPARRGDLPARPLAVEAERGRADRRQGQVGAGSRPTGSSRSRRPRRAPPARGAARRPAAELACSSRLRARPCAERRCRLVTLVGEPGVGKSRLAAELEPRVGRRGAGAARALPLLWRGDHVLAAGGDRASGGRRSRTRTRARRRGRGSPRCSRGERRRPGRERARAPPSASARGRRRPRRSPGRPAGCSSRSLASGPLLVLVDDLQWASRRCSSCCATCERCEDAPRSCCSASPVPSCSTSNKAGAPTCGWSRSRREAATALLDRLAARRTRAATPRALARRAGGNPLFLEELAALVARADGAEDDAADDACSALLAARLDRLPEPERAALERGVDRRRGLPPRRRRRALARGAARARSADSGALRRKELVRPAAPTSSARPPSASATSSSATPPTTAPPKKLRAELHERFADWLEQTAGERVPEYEEILGYHLEQAYRYREELGPVDDARSGACGAGVGAPLFSRGSGRQAARRLSGSRESPDARAALSDPTVMRIAPKSCSGCRGRDSTRRSRGRRFAAHEAVEAAAAAGDSGLEWRARLREATVNMWRGAPTDDLVRVATSALEVFDEIGYDRGAQAAWGSLQIAYSWRGRFAAAIDALDRCHEYRRRAGEPHQDGDFAYLAGALLFGPTPVEEAIVRGSGPAPRDGQRLHAGPTHAHAWVARSDGRPLRPRPRAIVSRPRHSTTLRASDGYGDNSANFAGSVKLLAERPAEAERILREGYRLLEDDTATKSSAAGGLAEALYQQGRDEEAEHSVRICEELSHPDDVEARPHGLQVRGKLAARRGAFEEGETLARAAVAVLDETDI